MTDKPQKLKNLAEICDEYFPEGTTVRTLRRAIRKHGLQFYRIGRTISLSTDQVNQLIEAMQCQDPKNRRGSTYAAAKGENPFGSSKTEKMKQAQDAAKAALNVPKKRSPATSQPSSSPGKVIRAKFQ